MTHDEFAKLQEQFFDDLRKLGVTKGVEYSDKEDRLANFKDEGKEMEIPSLKVAHIFFNKHYRAICSYIREGHEFSDETIYGRFKDAVLYLILMYGLVVDRCQREKKEIKLQTDMSPEEKTTAKVDIWDPRCSYCYNFLLSGDRYVTKGMSIYHENCFENAEKEKRNTVTQDK